MRREEPDLAEPTAQKGPAHRRPEKRVLRRITHKRNDTGASHTGEIHTIPRTHPAPHTHDTTNMITKEDSTAHTVLPSHFMLHDCSPSDAKTASPIRLYAPGMPQSMTLRTNMVALGAGDEDHAMENEHCDKRSPLEQSTTFQLLCDRREFRPMEKKQHKLQRTETRRWARPHPPKAPMGPATPGEKRAAAQMPKLGAMTMGAFSSSPKVQ